MRETSTQSSGLKRWAPYLLLVLIACIGSCGPDVPQSQAPYSPPDLTQHPIYSKYDFGRDEHILDIGVQPMWMPVSIIVETMKRDAVLHAALDSLGISIRFHSFAKGADINFFLKRGDLDAGIGGDMPALVAAATSDIRVASLMQHGFVSIMATRPMLLTELKGHRIGYAPGSNAHFALQEALAAIGISTNDVKMIPLDVNDMPEAMLRKEIDLFCAWEPVPTIAKFSQGAFRVYSSLSTGYLYFSADYAQSQYEASKELIASQLRAMAWLNADYSNRLTASGWAKQAWKTFTGADIPLSRNQLASIAEHDLLSISTLAIVNPRLLNPGSRLHNEFQFLKNEGTVPESSNWNTVRSSFTFPAIEDILRHPNNYSINNFRVLNDLEADEDD